MPLCDCIFWELHVPEAFVERTRARKRSNRFRHSKFMMNNIVSKYLTHSTLNNYLASKLKHQRWFQQLSTPTPIRFGCVNH